MTLRRLVAALALALAGPAAAYLPPPSLVVRKVAEKRSTLAVTAVEATGSLELLGPAVARLGPLAPAGATLVTLPARILVKTAGKVRLELQPPSLAEGERPFVSVREDRLAGRAGLEAVPALSGLVRTLAALLGTPGGGDGVALAEALARRGVKLDQVSLGRFNGRIAYVLGGRPTEPRPLASFDKRTFLPLRLQLAEGGSRLDVRLLDWSSPNGGDWFPRAVEVWEGPAILVRFTTDRAVGNPKLAESLFQ